MRIQYENISLELLKFGRIPSSPNWSRDAHSHHFYEIHFITGGKGLNRIDTGEMDFYPNIVYLAPPHETHAQWSDRNSPLELIYLSFNISFPENMKPLPRIYAPFSFVRPELDMILQRDNKNGISDRFLARLRLLELVWKVIGSYAWLQESAIYPQIFTRLNEPACEQERAILFIQRYFHRNPSLSEIAHACGISPRHLSRLFMQSIGITPHQFVQNERFAWAMVELKNSSSHYRDIAEALHFSSLQYFSSWFKQMCSMTPAEFRKYHTAK